MTTPPLFPAFPDIPVLIVFTATSLQRERGGREGGGREEGGRREGGRGGGRKGCTCTCSSKTANLFSQVRVFNLSSDVVAELSGQQVEPHGYIHVHACMCVY